MHFIRQFYEIEGHLKLSKVRAIFDGLFMKDDNSLAEFGGKFGVVAVNLLRN